MREFKFIGLIKGDTRSLDYGSYRDGGNLVGLGPGFREAILLILNLFYCIEFKLPIPSPPEFPHVGVPKWCKTFSIHGSIGVLILFTVLELCCGGLGH